MGHSRRRLGVGRAGGRRGAAALGRRRRAERRAAPMSKPKALIAWSSGKDSAWALHEVRRAGEYDVVGALTTITETFGRVSIHGLREELLRAQLAAAGLPPTIVSIPYPCPNEFHSFVAAGPMLDGRIAVHLGETVERDGFAYADLVPDISFRRQARASHATLSETEKLEMHREERFEVLVGPPALEFVELNECLRIFAVERPEFRRGQLDEVTAVCDI